MKRLLVAIFAFVVVVSIADARPRHHHHHRHHTSVEKTNYNFDDRFAVSAPRSFAADAGSSGGIIREMRRHLGDNPTGWRRVWCGVFLDMVLRRTGHAKGSPLARAYSKYGHAAAGPATGTIVVWRHHVGVVTAVSHGSITVISGNDGRRVRERSRSTAGVIAYRWP